MEKFEMPENYDCICQAGRTYDKENEYCKKCVKASKTLDMLFDKVTEEGNPEITSLLLFSLLAAKSEKEKEKKEENFENE